MRLISILLCGVAACWAGEWPQFRGLNASGVAQSDANPPIEFGPAKKLLWKIAMPIGHGSPVVWGDRVFVTAFERTAKKFEVIAVNSKTGAILWRKAASAEQIEETHNVSNPATASPLADAERVYAYFSSYGVMAFDHAGAPAWTLPLAMPKTHHGSGASPILAGELLIVNHDAQQGGYLLAANRRTGKEVWRTPYEGRIESYSTPVVWKDQIVVHRAGVIESYDSATGKKRWSLAAATSGASTPAVLGDLLYVNTWNNLGEDDQRPVLPDFAALLKQYDKNSDGKISETEFPTDLKFTARPEIDYIQNSQNFAAFRTVDRDRNGAIDAAEWDTFRSRVTTMAQDHGLLAIRPGADSASIAWRENSSIPEVPSPLLFGGRAFLIRNGGVASSIDAATGKLIYRSRVGAAGAYFASPITAANRIYVASNEGVISVIAAGGQKLEVLARNPLGEEIVATPAIAGKAIYIRTLQHLYAFGER